MTATAEPEVGKARLRKEDARLITGRTKWTDNIQLTGMLHMAVLRSPVAHARIRNIDCSRATTMPGVAVVLTREDVAAAQGTLPGARPNTAAKKSPPAPPQAPAPAGVFPQ